MTKEVATVLKIYNIKFDFTENPVWNYCNEIPNSISAF